MTVLGASYIIQSNKRKEDKKKKEETNTSTTLPATNPKTVTNAQKNAVQDIYQVSGVPSSASQYASMPTTGLNRTNTNTVTKTTPDTTQSGWAVRNNTVTLDKTLESPLTGKAYDGMTNQLGRDIKLWNSNGSNTVSGTNYYGDTGSTGSNAGTGSYSYSNANKISGFNPSAAYTQAMAYTNQMLEQLQSGRTSYTDQINSVLDSINNRSAFQYDMNTDPLFQQSLQSAMQSGKTAMADTMGQAAGLTGGYGSTYATAAANGAYNQYIQDAYDNVADYYNLARNAYDTETNELYNKLSMYQGLDQDEYNRLANNYGLSYSAAQDQYNKEYNNYWNTISQNESMRQYDTDMAYKYAALNEDARQADLNNTYKYMSLYGSDGSGSSSSAPSIDSNMYKTGLGYYENGGNAAGTDFDNWITSLYEQGYNSSDIEKLTNYAVSNGQRTGFYISDYGKMKNGKGVTIKDNTYVDNLGREFTYEQMKNMGYTDKELKALEERLKSN